MFKAAAKVIQKNEMTKKKSKKCDFFYIITKKQRELIGSGVNFETFYYLLA